MKYMVLLKKYLPIVSLILVAFLVITCSRKTTHEKLQGDWIEAGKPYHIYNLILNIEGDSIEGVYWEQPKRYRMLFQLTDNAMSVKLLGENKKEYQTLIIDKVTNDSLIFKNFGRFYKTDVYYDTTIHLEKIISSSYGMGGNYYFEASRESVFYYSSEWGENSTEDILAGAIDTTTFKLLQEKVRNSNVLQVDSFYITYHVLDGGENSLALYYNNGKRKAVYVSNAKGPIALAPLRIALRRAPGLCRLRGLGYGKKEVGRFLLERRMRYLPCTYYNNFFFYQNYKDLKDYYK